MTENPQFDHNMAISQSKENGIIAYSEGLTQRHPTPEQWMWELFTVTDNVHYADVTRYEDIDEFVCHKTKTYAREKILFGRMRTMGGGIREYGARAFQLGLDNSPCFRVDTSYESPKDKFMVPYLHVAQNEASEPEIRGVTFVLITREQVDKIQEEIERALGDDMAETALHQKFINEIYYGREEE